jgi:hypothetical protein
MQAVCSGVVPVYFKLLFLSPLDFASIQMTMSPCIHVSFVFRLLNMQKELENLLQNKINTLK